MRQFNQKPEYNENYFKKQLEQMRVKRNKFLSAEIEGEKFIPQKQTYAWINIRLLFTSPSIYLIRGYILIYK